MIVFLSEQYVDGYSKDRRSVDAHVLLDRVG
jgi:hypothetical protein